MLAKRHVGSGNEIGLSPPQRLKLFFISGGVNPLSNVSAGTELQATAESAGVLRLIDPFDFAPAVHFAQRIYITNT